MVAVVVVVGVLVAVDVGVCVFVVVGVVLLHDLNLDSSYARIMLEM